jgi:hypothetical protein
MKNNHVIQIIDQQIKLLEIFLENFRQDLDEADANDADRQVEIKTDIKITLGKIESLVGLRNILSSDEA